MAIPHSHFKGPWLLAAAALAAVALGCASDGDAQRDSAAKPGEDELSRAAVDLESLYKDLAREREAARSDTPGDWGTLPPRRPQAPPPRPPVSADTTPRNPDPAGGSTAAPTAPMVFTPATPEPEQTRRDRLVAELSALLSGMETTPGRSDPLARAIDLTIVESLRGGGAAAPSPALTALRSQLSPPQLELLDTLREMLALAPKQAGGDTSALSAMLSRAAARLQSSAESIRIPTAVLCSRVESFGRYTPLSTRLIAGRRHAALVYVEVENFAHRPASQGGGNGAEADEFVVELGQELNLFHDADGLLAWKKPEQPIREVSRNRRRDYFLVQRIDLPPTLTVGKYVFKVIIRDKATGAQAQASIPISVVADDSTADAAPIPDAD